MASTTQTPSQPLGLDEVFASLGVAAPRWADEARAAVAGALDSGDGSWLIALVVMLAAGVVGERLACFKLQSLIKVVLSQSSERWTVNAGYALFRMVFDLVGVLLFGLFAWLALYLSIDSGTPAYLTLKRLIVAVVTFRAWAVVIRAVLAPRSEGIRPIALDSDDAMAFYRWTLLFIGVYVATVFVIETLALSMTPVLVGATLAIVGLFGVNLIAHLFVWSNRVRLGRLFSSPYSVKERPSGLRQVIAQSWPYMVSVWLALLWVNWAYSIVTGDAEREQALLLSWWVTLLFPIGDRLVNALLMRLSGANLLSNWGFDARRERFVRVVQGCLRAIFAIVALGAMAVTWQVAGSDVLSSSWGKQAVAAMVEILLTVLAAYVLYEVVSAMLERHMPDDDQPAGEIEGEGGGAGATRQETLAPLLRGVFLVVLAIVVGLSVLSALGVQILPLIAGASIVGLAVGFGSQKLVQDVISGVFFLVDDAFRRGEYIEVGEIKGTVEKISIRSMQLRHHMGALHTIPFGEIRHLTNFSRDWVMMKLKLRLTYDTDVERVRKLIKKLGQEMLDDPELGEKFLEPLKSQGVYSMEDDSAMIIRVKFMTRPGDQFTVRKTVYARIRELFEREGIEFANRMVTVKLDGAGKDELSEAQQQQVAGAALAAGGGTRLP